MGDSRTTICNLPDELILETVRYLDCTRSSEPQSTAFKEKEKEKSRQRENNIRRVALHSLCLTTHRLRRIATPVLYASFIGSATWHGYEPLKLFHRTISNSAHSVGLGTHLADYIEYVENRLCDYLGNSLYDDTEFYGAVRMVAQYFYLLSDIVKHAPNLQHLSVVSLETDEVSFWNYILPKSSNTPSPLMPEKVASHGLLKLQTLCFQIHTEGYGFGLDAAWFRRVGSAMSSVPLLLDLRASGVMTSGLAVPCFASFKYLQRLEITECVLDFGEIVDAWDACHGLRHIVCEWAFLNGGGERPSDLYAGLLRHASTLESLSLDTREVRYDNSANVAAPTSLGSLRSFTALRSLTMCEICLLDAVFPLLDFPDQPVHQHVAKSLPDHLESLSILLRSDFGYEFDSRLDEAFALWHLAEDSKKVLPNLKEVSVRYPLSLNAPNLAKAFQEAGLQFAVIKEVKSGAFG